ncbi:protein kinase superfamily protein [Actinidia rufa]|uniref:Protein kinase superfamily protein n=1 Tax=Actinidia rufa TaxID=165716 RepID=A0A7J0DYA5_9ERIC|nr:protein kinase superfamily protein [Actinidia rufa]
MILAQSIKIGEGGFGSVYKGKLKNGKIGAIKVLSAESKQGVREFLTEIKVISDVHHENLVKLYGCCVEGDHRILVYNYLENNSLARTLLGYLAPEYAIRGQLTRKADVYSFGVLLVEIVSGRCNTNSLLPVEEKYLLERTWDLYERRELVGLVDASLNGDFDAEEACRFLKIGLLCTQDTPKLRPSMSSVVKMLTGKVNINENEITKPALISDFMDMKVKPTPKPKPDILTASYNYASSDMENSLLSSGTSTCATMTFTSVYDPRI